MIKVSGHIEGLEQTVKALKVLPDKFQRQAVLKIERKAARPVVRSARSKLLGYGSNFSKLAKSIGTITAKSKNPIIYVGPRVKGKWKMIGYIAHWVEYGVSGVKGNNAGTRSWRRTPENEQFAKWVGRKRKGERYRSDQPARPFMRPAIDANMAKVKSNLIQYFKVDLEKHINKLLTKVR